jgi:hypothetical protein
MLYTDLIGDALVTMTARQLRLAIQEAGLVSREQALNEAASLVEETDGKPRSIAWLREFADQAATEREDVAREGLATRGLVS